jgi:hypothetical protein
VENDLAEEVLGDGGWLNVAVIDGLHGVAGRLR